MEKSPKDKTPSNLAIIGRYVLTPDIFDKINETESGVGGEIPLTDAFKNWIQYTESHSKVKLMTLHNWSGLRHPLNLP